MKTKNYLAIFIWLLVFIFLGIFTAWFQDAYRIAEPTERHTSFSRDPGGTLALYMTLEKAGVKVKRWLRPPNELDNTVSVVIMMNSVLFDDENQHQTPPEDIKRFHDWISNGGTAIVLGANGKATDWIDSKGIIEEYPKEKDDTKKNLDEFDDPKNNAGNDYQANAEMSLYTDGIKAINGKEDIRFLIISKEWKPLLKDDKGVILAIKPCGKGWIIYGADADWTSNQLLGKNDNSAMIYRIIALHSANGGNVVFDEYHYGYTEDTQSFWARIGGGGRFIFIQIALIIAVIMFSVGRRFGLINPARVKLPSMNEYIIALATTYKKANARNLALESLYNDLLRKLTTRFNCPINADESVIITKIPGHYHDKIIRIKNALTRKLTDAELLETARLIDEITKELT